MQRTVIAEDYRVTTYAIRWTGMPEEAVTEGAVAGEAGSDDVLVAGRH